MAASKLSNRFSITQAKSLVKDLSKPNPKIYWFDFLATILCGHAAFVLLVNIETVANFFRVGPLSVTLAIAYLTAARLALFAVAAILYMRAAMFIHELVHLPSEGFQAFRVAWNLLCGIPFLIPSFLYYPHVDHHRRKHYGTDKDGEYLDLSHRHPANLLLFVAAALVVPLAAFVRFAVMAPLSWVVPGFRNWVERRASSMVVDVFYLRGDYGKTAHRIMRVQEAVCFVWCVALISWGPLTGRGLLNPVVLYAYALAAALILLNNIRTLGAHRWTGAGQELSFEEQLLDSVNYPYRSWITELWGPVGTRYHAIHHLFPSIPYHNLGIAHRRLMAGLPADSLYRETVRVSLLGAIAELWSRAASRNSGDSNTGAEQHRSSNAA